MEPQDIGHLNDIWGLLHQPTLVIIHAFLRLIFVASLLVYLAEVAWTYRTRPQSTFAPDVPD